MTMATLDLAGELKVRVVVRDGVVHSVAIDSTRPQLANRLLAGRPADEAVAMVPQLFSICGRAQQVAAELALAAARGAPAEADAQQRRRVEAEIAQEYLWRALIDWARAAGGQPDATRLAAAREAAAHDDRDLLREIVERDVLGGDARQWCEHEHQGYVLEGRLEIAFPYGLRVYEPGDGIFVRPGREHRHKHRALTDVVRVIYVEYI